MLIRRGRGEGTDRPEDRLRRRAGGRRPASVVEPPATAGHARLEFVADPFAVPGSPRGRAGPDPGVPEVGVHRGAMIPPRGHAGHTVDRDVRLVGEHAPGPVLVEAHHREPVLGRQVSRRSPGDQPVGIARAGHDQHARGLGRFVDRPPLRLKDRAAGPQRVRPVHPQPVGGALRAGRSSRPRRTPRPRRSRPGPTRARGSNSRPAPSSWRRAEASPRGLPAGSTPPAGRSRISAGGDAEEQGITDPTGRAGHGEMRMGSGTVRNPPGCRPLDLADRTWAVPRNCADNTTRRARPDSSLPVALPTVR